MLFGELKPFHLTTTFHRHNKQKVSYDYAHFSFIFSFLYIENNNTERSLPLLPQAHT